MDERLSGILSEMRRLVVESKRDAESAHSEADDLLVVAARHCGTLEEILAAYEEVEKWYA